MKNASPESKTNFNRNVLGIALIVCAVLCFSCMDASAKWLGRSMNPMQVVAVRYIGSLIFASMLLNPWRTPQVMRTKRPWLQCGRSACLLVTTTCSYVALRYLPLTELTAINFAAPLIVTLLVGPFLGEKIGPRRVIAVIVGFIGVLIVTRPGGHGIHMAALLALLGSLANAFYSIATRKLVGHDSLETTMFYTGMVGSVALAPVLFFVWSTPDSFLTWAVMLLIGGLGAIAHWLLILAHKYSPASVLAPFYYAQLIGAAVIAMTIFGEFPDIWTILGGSIIIGSGLYVLYRERVRKREENALTTDS